MKPHNMRMGDNRLGNTIRLWRKRRKLSQTELAQRCGWESQSRISQYERGKRSPHLADISKIAIALDIDVSELLSERRGLGATPGATGNVEAGPEVRGRFPLISWVQAGRWSEIVDNFAPGDAEDWIPSPAACGPRTFVLRVRGESMYDKFCDGELIFVDPDAAIDPGRYVVVRYNGDEATLKQLITENGRLYLKAYNPAWPDRIIPFPEDAEICGVVVARFEYL